MNSLSIKNLTKTYANGVQALSNISLEINNGMFGLLGPNGAGKSSLMRTIVGLQTADSGEILLNGTNILENPMFIKEQLGFLPQDFGVYPKISAYELLNHIAILKGVSNKTARKEQIESLLEKVNLSSQKNKEVHTFSGGMRQRFGVAQALLGNPKIIIVDEPTAGLDPEERNRFNGLLSEIGSERIVILSTHLVEDVRNLCSQMAIMQNGKVLLQGNPNDFVTELKGKIWQKQISKEALEKYKSNFYVIASHYVGGKLNIQVFSEEILPDFEAIQPSLEEVYFKTLNQI
ncbi:ABC transporter ATP-binding protein [Flavobacterium aquatile]|uniref:Multidrug ABC transporter ATPase n=1 Tax=Flavobacterium aquatile LMG 4008 = ATCC 11947 TaxID=1453498 RepID=A0A095SQM9_9FLAO|nr:ABC transporter ATP-binding protein [Flavobacterium aquatile]KGD66892.1 multidrug ABC transporter ATPase [Flavobacterium aquatile LMG 4008 = ATCC 11947]OXA67986.1 multidrug ABC transporter ATP-binding protein [Flavobacterium aquatile LMG 4008 = ATCC 11947]GEC80036.1 multidrug ABC transporter ATP-binding protein [Flavobacterium aquatile]